MIDYTFALLMDRNDEKRYRRLMLIMGISANLFILAYFKYVDFLIISFNTMMHAVNFNQTIPLKYVLLPIAISFHTFQSMSYLIDVYWRLVRPVRNLLDYQLFVSFFPVLVAGPIERAQHLLPQILKSRRVSNDDIIAGAKLVLLGYFKKVVIADNMAVMVDAVYSKQGGGFAVILATYAFALQIYGDFSGYTDIARGVSRFLGFKLMDNFKQPYFAINPSDFWRRWHISLSTWLRDYLYIPLGGNRNGLRRMYFALFTTMVIGGLWHGASWTFVLWGAYHGLLLIMHRIFKRVASTSKIIEPTMFSVRKVIKIVMFFQLTAIGWLLFRAMNWISLKDLMTRLLTKSNWFDLTGINVRLLLFAAILVITIDFINEKKINIFKEFPTWMNYAYYGLATIFISVFWPAKISSFIYFQF